MQVLSGLCLSPKCRMRGNSNLRVLSLCPTHLTCPVILQGKGGGYAPRSCHGKASHGCFVDAVGLYNLSFSAAGVWLSAKSDPFPVSLASLVRRSWNAPLALEPITPVAGKARSAKTGQKGCSRPTSLDRSSCASFRSCSASRERVQCAATEVVTALQERAPRAPAETPWTRRLPPRALP